MGAPTSDGNHHHRSTTKQHNKPYKTRHASKSEIKERSKGKVEQFEVGHRRTPSQQMMSKLERRNQAKQKRKSHAAQKEEAASVFVGRAGAPRIVAVVPLCASIDSRSVVDGLNTSVDVESPTEDARQQIVEIPRFKQKMQYLTPQRDLFQTLDACRAADFLLLTLSAEEEVDQLGEQMLRCIESQGVSTVFCGAHNLDKVEPAKRRPDVLKSLKSYITHFFAAQEKVHDLSNRQDCSNVMRSLCTTTPKGIRWREDRSWMVIEDTRWQDADFVISGVVRGKPLKSDRLIQLGDWGDFQIDKITAAHSSRRPGTNADVMALDEERAEGLLDEPSEDRDDLAELAPEDAVMDGTSTPPAASIAPSERKHVSLDDHHYFDDSGDEDAITVPKRLPKGTSKYQSAWFLGNMSDSASDMEDVEEAGNDFDGFDDASIGPADGHFDESRQTEADGVSEYPQSEAFDDPAPEDEAQQLAAYRKQRREEAEDDLEFPDEIELHPHVLAKDRLARYRGLKSLRTSQWNTEEDVPFQPEDWDRLLEISDYKSARNRVLKDSLIGGVKAGSRINIHLRMTPEQTSELQTKTSPAVLFSLLRHEHKQTVINASISLSSDYPAPLKSKTELILQCGPRRLCINPLFSQAGNTPNNVHKFERYLHPGRTAVASFIGPVGWGSVPCLFFLPPSSDGATDAVEDLAQAMDATEEKPSALSLELIATGTLLPPSTSRVIAKRVVLTGNPYKIHKKLVTIRYMFFNDDDVEFFKSLPLWTRRGRSGFIKEPLGTHGYFKATFDGKINPMDSVGVSLYKRVWPRPARLWSQDGTSGGVAAEEDEEMHE